MTETNKEILKDIRAGRISADGLVRLLSLQTREEFRPVFDESARVCRRHFGDRVFIRGIVEFSNYCRKGCFYCGINKANRIVGRYRLSLDEILAAAAYMKKQGVLTVVLQAGEDQGSDGLVIEAVKKIKNGMNMAVTLSVGERDRGVYRDLFRAGADRYLHRIETTDPALYKRLHPDDDLDYRTQCLFNLKELGFEVGTGIMVGLPGQSLASIARDLLFFKELNPAMVGIGPFLPHQDTPLRGCTNSDIFPTLKTLALIRLLLPKSNLPATTAMGTIDPTGRQQALTVGANVIMPNFTPAKYRESYKLYDNKICLSEEYGKCAACMATIAGTAGKRIVRSKGYSRVSG
ncbi:MAG: [FeFe] hydrogenase H-cluster radical SAM maturase HydE [Candidatus Aminicenantes bacterium]|nr:[FeFe] hydrogenase H-cluster radical SAM maturase HydE [Candidatus Aminicenantes bacterium]